MILTKLVLRGSICAILCAVLRAGNCSGGSAGTTVFYVNGIRTTQLQAEGDLDKLQDRVLAALDGTPQSTECLAFRPAYNETNGTWSDLWQSVRQRLNQDASLFARYVADIDSAPLWFQAAFGAAAVTIDELANEPEIAGHLQDYESERAQGNTIILVAHSQGNLYANAEYRKLQLRSWPVPDNKVFSIVSVATPAKTVEGGGPWTTLLFDPIFDFVFYPSGSLGSTTTNLPQHLDGHAFVGKYLTGRECLPGIDPLICQSESPSRSETRIMGHILNAIPVRTNPTAGFVMTSQGKSASQGHSLNLTAAPGGSVSVSFDGSYPTYSKDDGSVTGWQWKVDSTVVATNATFSRAFTIGTYNVSLVVTDNLGAQSPAATGVVIVTETGQPTFNEFSFTFDTSTKLLNIPDAGYTSATFYWFNGIGEGMCSQRLDLNGSGVSPYVNTDISIFYNTCGIDSVIDSHLYTVFLYITGNNGLSFPQNADWYKSNPLVNSTSNQLR